MELVYLWVEEYKNIRNQGFNFSPRFKCEFDGENLTITENKDYVGIFPDNINVTAIVGKNGSGKSGILEYIVRNIYYYYYKSEKMEKSHYQNFMLFYDNHSNEISIIWNIYKHITIKNNTNVKIEKNKIEPRWKPPKTMPFKLEENEDFDSSYYKKAIDMFKNNSYILHYDYSFSRFYINDKTIGSVSRVTEIEQLYSSELDSILCLPNKNNINKDTFDSNNDKFTIIKTLVSNNKNIDFKSNYFKPNIVTLKISHSIDIKKSNFEILNELLNEYIEDKIFQPNNIYLSNDKIDENIKKAKDLEKTKAKKYLEILKKYESQINELFTVKDITVGYNNPIRFIFNIQIKELNTNNIELLTEVPKNLFEIDLIEGDRTFGKTYEELSNGEKAILRIIYSIENIVYSTKKQEFYILLEEVEKDLHPDWQKELLNYLIKVFENRKPNFHFIITSHSPFLLSDLPEGNVIFLEKYKENDDEVKKDNQKESNCKNISKDIKLKTFGANIHTLLSNGFFMSDGLMGEFAKSKINEAIDNLHGKSQSLLQKQIKSIIDSIGEPFLQIKLKQMYKEKFGLDDEIEELEKRQEEINLKIEQLKKQKSENAKS